MARSVTPTQEAIIPFGSAIAGVENPSPELVGEERGLRFIAFAGTIEDQFEFVTRRWANSAIQPRFGGHDPIRLT